MSRDLALADADFLAHREAEDRAADERRDEQLARADLTPLDPAPGGWVAETVWQPLAGYSETYGDQTRGWHDSYVEASRSGRQLACCAGAHRVRVVGPDGTVHATWDREGNFWLLHTDEARQGDTRPRSV